MEYQGLGPAQSIALLLVLVVLAFAPRFVAWAIHLDDKDRQEEQDADALPVVMDPVQTLARTMYGEAYGWGNLDMLNYDHCPWVREPWERSAAARLARKSDTLGTAYPPEATQHG